MPRMVLGEVSLRCWLYLAATPSHMGVYVDMLASPLDHPMVCSRQTRGHGFPSGAALSRRTTVSGGAFLGHAKPLGLDI
jgi:hypothetical protein